MNLSHKMRIYHRYLGFFLVGIMSVYAVSGIILIFRDTDFLKSEVTMVKEVAPNLSAEELGKAIRVRDLKVDREADNIVYFKQGTYNKATGVAEYKMKQLPFVIDKMTKLHKANTGHPLFFLNIFFGVALLFFVISSFWMFLPSTTVFRKGLYFVIGGVVLTIALLFI